MDDADVPIVQIVEHAPNVIRSRCLVCIEVLTINRQ